MEVTPSYAEQARTILAANAEATLATVDVDGRPVVAPVPMVADASGVPVMVVSNLSTHSSRGRRDTRAGMDVGGRLLIQGDLRSVPGIQQIEMTDAVCEARPDLRTAIESLDWSWLRLEPTRIRLTDDDGDERWLRPADVAGAEPDPLVLLGPDFIEEVREKLADQVLLVAKTLGGRWLGTSADVAAIDRYGITLRVDEPAGTRDSRVPFPDRIEEATDVHAALGALVLAARAAARRDDAPGSTSDLATTLLDSVKRDRRSGTDVDGVDGAGHGYSNALINGLQHAAAQTRALGPQQDGESILLTEAELFEGESIRPWREGEQLEPVGSEDIQPIGEGVEPGIGEGVGLTHADPAGSAIEGIAARGVAEEGVDTEPGSASQDHAHVGGIADVLEHDDGARVVLGEDLSD